MKHFSSTKLVRRTIAPLFCVLALAVCAFAQTGNTSADRQLQLWRSYSPADVNFTVSLPNEPTRGTAATPFEDVWSVKYQSITSGAVFQVIQTDVPASVGPNDLKTIFDQMVKAGMEEVDKQLNGAVITKPRDISANNFQGREITVEKGTAVSTVRMYLAGRKFFVVEMVRPQFPNTPPALLKVYQAESDKFFNSFKILDNKKPEKKPVNSQQSAVNKKS